MSTSNYSAVKISFSFYPVAVRRMKRVFPPLTIIRGNVVFEGEYVAKKGEGYLVFLILEELNAIHFWLTVIKRPVATLKLASHSAFFNMHFA